MITFLPEISIISRFYFFYSIMLIDFFSIAQVKKHGSFILSKDSHWISFRLLSGPVCQFY